MDHGSVAAFVATYGYAAVFAGAVMEGETLLVAAGFAAHQGLLSWPLVVAVAMAGAILGDQIAFFLGRWAGPQLLARFPALARRAPRVHELLRRHDAICIVTLRFLYGLRIAGPVVVGSSGVSPPRFALFNTLGAALWAPAVAGAGYAFGLALTALIDHVERVEHLVLLGILAVGTCFWLWRRRREGSRR
jgi:membrane protein DedA with SNARE-associated domain